MNGHTVIRKGAALSVLLLVGVVAGCVGDPVGPGSTVAELRPSLSVEGETDVGAFGASLIFGAATTQTSPWYVGWSRIDTDSLGNSVQLVGVRPSTAVPVRSTLTYMNGVLRERKALLWEPVVGGWELVRVNSTFFNADGSFYASLVKTPDELGMTSFLSSTCAVSFAFSASGCFSGTARSVFGFGILVATAPAAAAGAPSTLGGAAAAWLLGWGVWTADLIDTVEACSGSGGGGSAVQKPTKRLT